MVRVGSVIEPLALPDSADWRDWLAARVEGLLDESRARLADLKDGAQRDAVAVLALWNDADIALRGAGSVASLLGEVHPDEAIRTLAEELSQAVSRAGTDRGLDRELFAVLAATSADGLDDDSARLRAEALRDFRRSGVDLDDERRDRLREINERLTVLDQELSRTIRDDVRSIRIPLERLDGLPQDWIDAHPPGADGLVTVTTDYPDLIPFRTFATDAAARLQLVEENLTRGWPANDDVLHEMFDLRHEYATLLGFEDWPSYDTEVKMIGTSQAIDDFIVKLAAAAAESGERDRDTLLARRRRDEPDATSIDSSCTTYYSELIRREEFGVDAQEVRRYFDFARVRQGLLDVTGALFGLRYLMIADAPRWHEDVAVYDVHQGVDRIGRIYLDLHPREGKFKHAAQFDLVGGIADRQLPEGALVCNFSRGLVEHSDVVTLFHEFGHLVHHVLGGTDQRYARFSGVATEWDFVEAPSQMLEEWAWDADALRTFAVDADGEPIPRDLVARMRAGDEFGKGLWVRNQLFYTAVSYELHRDRPSDLTERVQQLQRTYDLNTYLPGTHFQDSFGHLGGYASAYYTYLWSLVIAKDMFSAFDAENLLDPAVAHRYRDTVLAPGGRKDAADLVADFLRRPFTFDSFAAWLGRT